MSIYSTCPDCKKSFETNHTCEVKRPPHRCKKPCRDPIHTRRNKPPVPTLEEWIEANPNLQFLRDNLRANLDGMTKMKKDNIGVKEFVDGEFFKRSQYKILAFPLLFVLDPVSTTIGFYQVVKSFYQSLCQRTEPPK